MSGPVSSGRPLRIAYALLRPPGYSETFIESEIRAVRAAGATVEVFAAGAGGGRYADAGRVSRACLGHPVRIGRHVRTLGVSYLPRAVLAGAHAMALSPAVAAFEPDVIHAHFVNLPTALAVLLGRELGRPVTAMAHAADFLLDSATPALDRRLHGLDHLFVISAATAQQLAGRGVRMDSVPHSVVRAAFDGQLAGDQPRPGVPAIPGAPARIVSVARLVEKKGIDIAIDAVAQLSETGHHVEYDVYGDGPLRRDLERRAERRGVGGMVSFHGAVSHDHATAALAAADIAVLPCRRAADGDLDGIPVFLMEAAAREVPVVATAVSGVPELVGDDGGWLVAPGDAGEVAGAVASAMRHILADPAGARTRSAALRRRLQEEFAPALQARRLLATWHRLAGVQPPQPVRPGAPMPALG